MTEPDDALLWARERCAELLEQEQLFSAANAIRSGANDAAIRLQVRAEAYRAGRAARDAEVEALRAENGRLLQFLAKAADTMDRAEATVNALIAALGIPPAPPKVAPWEAAYDDWLQTAPTLPGCHMTWIAAWAACEQHYNIMGDDA